MGLIQNLHLAGVCIFSEDLAPAGEGGGGAGGMLGNRQIMLSVGKETLASALQKAPGTQMKAKPPPPPPPLNVCTSARSSEHVYAFSCLLVCVICSRGYT